MLPCKVFFQFLPAGLSLQRQFDSPTKAQRYPATFDRFFHFSTAEIMKLRFYQRTSWLCWLLALSAICLSEAQYKFRRPHLPPPMPPPQIFKKSWAPGPRIPPVGNSLHMGPNFPPKRLMFKPPNYR